MIDRGEAVVPEGPGDLVVFDLDGVLYAGDTFTEFARARFRSPRRLARAAGVAVRSLRPGPAEAPHLLALLAVAAVQGMTNTEYERAAQQFGAALACGSRVLRQGVAAARAHEESGQQVVVATACEQTMAEAFVRGLGLAAPVIGSALNPQAGTMRHNRGPEKVQALARAGYPARAVAAYTDSLTDLPMLRMADRPVLVNPSHKQWRQARAELPRVERVVWR